MWTKKELKDALKREHWAALHCDKMEYRVVQRMDGKLEVQEWIANSNSWYQGQHILKVFSYAPSINEIFPNGKPDAIAFKQEQGAYIRIFLDDDVNDIVEWYEDEYGVKVK